MKKINMLYLMLSEDCNLNCSYCYERKKQNKKMSNDTIEQSLKCMLNKYDVRSITLFGGEPTLNFDGINKVLELVPPNITLTMVTNGLLINEDILHKIKERGNFTIQVSLDGNYSSMKERVNSYESFLTIIENAKKYRAATDNFLFHIAVTKKNLPCLYENYLFLLNLKLTNQINITNNFNEDWNEQDYFIYETQLVMMKDYLLSLGEKTNIRPISSYPFKKGDHACPSGIHNLLINADGNIYPCSRMYTSFGDKFLLGNVYQKNDIDVSFFEKISFKNTKCQNCEIDQCIRCYAANLEKTGDIVKCNPAHCSISFINNKINKEFHEEFESRKGPN